MDIRIRVIEEEAVSILKMAVKGVVGAAQGADDLQPSDMFPYRSGIRFMPFRP